MKTIPYLYTINLKQYHMKNYYVTIMSIDPNDHYGREQGDDHQKYGVSVIAKDDKDAQEKGVVQFKQQHGNLPIFWVKSFETEEEEI